MRFQVFLVVILLSAVITLRVSAKTAESTADDKESSEARQDVKSDEAAKQSSKSTKSAKLTPKAKPKVNDDAELSVRVSSESTKKGKASKAPSVSKPKNATVSSPTSAFNKKNRVVKTPKPSWKPDTKPSGGLLNDKFFKEETKPGRHLPQAAASHPRVDDAPRPSPAQYPEMNQPPATTAPAAQGLKKDDIQNLFGDMAKPARRKKDTDNEEGRAAKGNPAKDMFAGMTGGMFGGLNRHQGGGGGPVGGIGGLGGFF